MDNDFESAMKILVKYASPPLVRDLVQHYTRESRLAVHLMNHSRMVKYQDRLAPLLTAQDAARTKLEQDGDADPSELQRVNEQVAAIEDRIASFKTNVDQMDELLKRCETTKDPLGIIAKVGGLTEEQADPSSSSSSSSESGEAEEDDNQKEDNKEAEQAPPSEGSDDDDGEDELDSSQPKDVDAEEPAKPDETRASVEKEVEAQGERS